MFSFNLACHDQSQHICRRHNARVGSFESLRSQEKGDRRIFLNQAEGAGSCFLIQTSIKKEKRVSFRFLTLPPKGGVGWRCLSVSPTVRAAVTMKVFGISKPNFIHIMLHVMRAWSPARLKYFRPRVIELWPLANMTGQNS